MEGSREARRAAAVAAVYLYLARGARMQRSVEEQHAAVRPPGVSPWALYGRRALMSQRIRMQARRRA